MWVHGVSPGRHVFKHHLNSISNLSSDDRSQNSKVLVVLGFSFPPCCKCGICVFMKDGLLVLMANAFWPFCGVFSGFAKKLKQTTGKSFTR